MGITQLESLRCRTCSKLLLKGALGLGIIEVKCGRCGSMNMFHSLDDLITERPDAYVLVFDNEGIIVAASHSAERILGYMTEEFTGLKMTTLNPAFKQPEAQTLAKYNISSDERDSSLIGKRTLEFSHTKKDGTQLALRGRHYPFGSLSGEHTLVILMPR